MKPKKNRFPTALAVYHSSYPFGSCILLGGLPIPQPPTRAPDLTSLPS